MGKVTLITGEPRVGKTTTLKNIVKDISREELGGFFTEEILENNERVGFRCISLSGEESIIAHKKYIYSDKRIGSYGLDLESFERVALKSISQSINKNKIILIDEIGPMQVMSSEFNSCLKYLIDSSEIILGTIFKESHVFIDPIKKNKNTTVYCLTPDNRETVTKSVSNDIKGIT